MYSFNLSHFDSGLGWVVVWLAFIIAVYYNMIIAWTIIYFVASIPALFGGDLPWKSCRNDWNSFSACLAHSSTRVTRRPLSY